MNFWLASANPQKVEKHMKLGVWRGVITNPAVVAAEKRAPKELFRELIDIAGKAWYQLRDASLEQMLNEAYAMLEIDGERIGIKVPATRAGLGVLRTLSDRGLDPMATVVPTSSWLTFAVAAGATMVAPYGSMVQKSGIASKQDEVAGMQQIIDVQGYPVELCTGIYDVTEIPLYARLGVRACFIWEKDVDAFFTQPLVEEACAKFAGDWQTIVDAAGS